MFALSWRSFRSVFVCNHFRDTIFVRFSNAGCDFDGTLSYYRAVWQAPLAGKPMLKATQTMQVQNNVSPTRFTEHAPTQRHTTRCPAGITVFHRTLLRKGRGHSGPAAEVIPELVHDKDCVVTTDERSEVLQVSSMAKGPAFWSSMMEGLRGLRSRLRAVWRPTCMPVWCPARRLRTFPVQRGHRPTAAGGRAAAGSGPVSFFSDGLFSVSLCLFVPAQQFEARSLKNNTVIRAIMHEDGLDLLLNPYLHGSLST